MLVIPDDLLVAATIQFRQSCNSFSDGAQFCQQTLLSGLSKAQAMQALAKGLMNGCCLTDTLAACEFIGESNGGRIFDVQGHERLQNSTFLAYSTMVP
ncbi:hypothetical protein X772_26760 [Mesorhizobium sp. LSJC280B00]|nr:hypothetical protein X772_26760 [Mesorhizobium sp. LSJC280B00]